MEPPREAEVGVLFVHGIGEQTPGDTLIAFGEPLVGWIRRWVQRLSSGRFEILKSAFSDPVLEAGEPAHLLFHYGWDNPSVRWLLAESCWATEFRRPPFGRLATWMVGVGAWMILSHFGKLLRHRLAGWKRWVFGLPVILFAVLLALLVQLLVAVLGLAALIPIPRLRRALSGLLLTLTGTLGDSYVLISSPVQEAAAVSRLRRDLTWLSDRVGKVVVIAHSQGAAIAHRALLGPRPGNVCRLITFGSGIGKLEELRLLERPANRDFYLAVQFGLPLATLSIMLVPRAAQALKSSYLLLGWDLYLFLLIVLGPALLLVSILARTWSGWPAYLHHCREELPLSGLEWHDFYSTADPVPNGPLSIGESGSLPWYRGFEIVNLRSALTDHSAYWANRDEFVPAIVREIDAAAGTELISPYDETMYLAKALRARQRRVQILLAMRAAAALGAALAFYGLRHQLRSLAEGLVWKPLTGWADTGLLGAVLGTLVSTLGAVARLVTGAAAETLRAWGLVALGALLLSSAVALSYLVATRAWKLWDRFAIDDVFSDKPQFSTIGAAVVAMLLGTTPLIFGVAALATGALEASLAVVGVTFWWYFQGLALAILLGLGLIVSVVYLPTIYVYWKKLLLAGAAILVGVPLLTFSIAALVTRDFQRSGEIVLATNVRLASALLPVGIVLCIAVPLLIWAWSSRR